MKKLIEEYVVGSMAADSAASKIISMTKSTHERSLDNKILLVKLLHNLKNNEERKESYLLLKGALINAVKLKPGSSLSWKDVMFQSGEYRASLSDVTLTSKFHLNTPCGLDDFQKKDLPEMNFSSVIGITHADNRKEVEDKTELCLDADYSCGYTGTTVDGIGAYLDIKDNKKIMKSSKLTAKYVTRIVNNVKGPDALYNAIPGIFSNVNALIRNYFRKLVVESACGVFTKAFYHDENMCEVVTGAVGDCMAFAWVPDLKKIVMLATARQHDFGPQFNPVAMTDKLVGTMIQRSRVILPRNAVIFRMTDGAWQMLPNVQSDTLLDEVGKRKYLESTIDDEKLSQLFVEFDYEHSNATAQDYRDVLLDEIIKNVNSVKASLEPLLGRIQSVCLVEFSKERDMECKDVMFHEFSDWLVFQDEETHDDFLTMLKRLECVIDLLDTVPVLALCDSLLTKVDIGDDTTLAVQSLREVGGFKKCIIC